MIASVSGTSGILSSGQALAANQSLTSPSGQYSRVGKSDGNLGQALWATNTAVTAQQVIRYAYKAKWLGDNLSTYNHLT